jgi:ribose-phosphate pyrophosphokinase
MALILAGSNTKELSERISKATGIGILDKSARRFPDGETYVRLDGKIVKGEDVFIVHSMYPGQNDSLVELFLEIDAVRRNGGRPVAVIPYMAYSRQDKTFQEGEAFSLEAVAKALKALGTERVITVDAHFNRKEGDFDLFGIPSVNITAAGILAEHARKTVGKDVIIAGPDLGSERFLSPVRGAVFLRKRKVCPECGKEATECRCKTKEKKYRVESIVPEGIRDMDVLLLDDMISTGGTIEAAAKALKERGNRVFVACTHGLFIGDALKRIAKDADGVFCTDTIETSVSEVSVADLIADRIKSA